MRYSTHAARLKRALRLVQQPPQLRRRDSRCARVLLCVRDVEALEHRARLHDVRRDRFGEVDVVTARFEVDQGALADLTGLEPM
jgi:hypothetical protein